MVSEKKSKGIWLEQPALWTGGGPVESRFHLSATDDGDTGAMDSVSASSSLHIS